MTNVYESFVFIFTSMFESGLRVFESFIFNWFPQNHMIHIIYTRAMLIKNFCNVLHCSFQAWCLGLGYSILFIFPDIGPSILTLYIEQKRKRYI